MQVRIKETGKVDKLTLLDPETGVDYTVDFIGGTAALNDGHFIYDEDQGTYLCDQQTFEWWEKVLGDNQLLARRIFELQQIHGTEAVFRAFDGVSIMDLEYYAACVNQALDEAFGGIRQ